jgi:hypothetical protein
MADRYEAEAMGLCPERYLSIAAALRAAERRGAESMRERAADVCDAMRSAATVDPGPWAGAREACASEIRALPLEVPDGE